KRKKLFFLIALGLLATTLTTIIIVSSLHDPEEKALRDQAMELCTEHYEKIGDDSACEEELDIWKNYTVEGKPEELSDEVIEGAEEEAPSLLVPREKVNKDEGENEESVNGNVSK